MLNVVLAIVMKGAFVGLLIGGIAYIGACLFLFIQQRRMLYFPSSILEFTPADRGLEFQDIWIPVPTQGAPERVHGWWIPASGDATGVILYLHGNGSNVSANLSHAERFHAMGFSVFLVDYRGYGLSDGRFPSESQAYDDVQVTWNYLTQNRGIEPQQIILYGHSLGGAIALDLAIRHPDAAGLVMEGTFTSILDMVNRTRNYGLFPIRLLLTEKFDSASKVRSLKMPLLLIHGLDDSVVPADMSQSLYKLAPDPKDLLLVPQAGHNDVADVAGEAYTQALRKFMQTTGLLEVHTH